MKKILLLTLFSVLSCSEDCTIDSEKLGALSLEAEVIREKLNGATTSALRNVYQLQLDEKRREMDEVAQACN